jgi:glycosyltransferase involved in cell wall biosynthesis
VRDAQEQWVNREAGALFESPAHAGPGEPGSAGIALSVIVPVLNGAELLPRCLGSLAASDFPRSRWQLIVVDDASADASAVVATGYADSVVMLQGKPGGPAYARNRGAEVARGRQLVFVDADVLLRPNALRLIYELFEEQADLGAAFGAYDAAPPARGLVSQYRNLLHHYIHSREEGDAETFWAGLGAVRADAFRRVGGFDAQRYPRPQIEDVELGSRLRGLGYRILLCPDIQGTHLKRWTLRGMIVTDVRDRGIPWMRLLRQRPALSGTLNLRAVEKAYTALAALGSASLLAALLSLDRIWLVPAAASFGVILGGNVPLLVWFARERGWWFALRIIPLRLLYYVLNVLSVVLGLLPDRGHAAAGTITATRDAPADRKALG